MKTNLESQIKALEYQLANGKVNNIYALKNKINSIKKQQINLIHKETFNQFLAR